MTLPIRPEVLPLDVPLQTANTTDKSTKPKPEADGNFAEVLNQELGHVERDDAKDEPRAEKKESQKTTGDAWTLYGIAPITLQVISSVTPGTFLKASDSAQTPENTICEGPSPQALPNPPSETILPGNSPPIQKTDALAETLAALAGKP